MSIAVIIPAYNATRFLPSTIRSVLAQTLPADEILVVDDGSTDDTAAVAEAFGPPVRVFRRKNARQAASRNYAAGQTDAEWLAFLDADDLWDAHKLQRQMEALAANPGADICYAGMVEFREKEGTIEYGRIFPGPPAAEIRHTLYEGEPILPSTVMVRRSTFLALGGFATAFRYCDDWNCWLRMHHAGIKFACCPDPLLLYRKHDENMSHDYLPLLQEQLNVFHGDIVGHYPMHRRWLVTARFYGKRLGEASYGQRNVGGKGYLSLMFRSVLCWPFNDFQRHKVLLHMTLTRLGLLSRSAPPNAEPFESINIKTRQQ